MNQIKKKKLVDFIRNFDSSFGEGFLIRNEIKNIKPQIIEKQKEIVPLYQDLTPILKKIDGIKIPETKIPDYIPYFLYN